MIGKNTIKKIKFLHKKKFRNDEKKFLVEGGKSLKELLKSDLEIENLFITKDFFEENKLLLDNFIFEIIDFETLQKITTLKINSDGLALVKQKENTFLKSENDLVLVLDDINDPGNLGTIIRIADWYGINKIIASKNTVEFYNPKVIISTMGSFTRVGLFYTDLENYFQENTGNIYGAFLEGENIHKTKLEKTGYIVIGNESNGISKEVEKYVNKKITIPSFGGAESLNAGVATGIIIDNFMR